MIVVEGPDGSGKTTLVKTLCREFDLHEFPRGTTNRDLLWTVTLQDTMRALSCAVQGHRKPYVCDRLYFSDFVYAPLQDREVAFSPDQQAHIERIIDAIDCPLIMCLPPVEVVKANAVKVHQMDTVNENLDRIYDSYLQLASMFGGMFFIYDYTIHDVNEPLRYVARYLNDTRKARSL